MKPLVCLTVGIMLAGCASQPIFPQPDRLWESFTGQLQYLTPGRSLIGEFTAARHGEDFYLEFSKGGAFPLLKLSRHGDFVRMEGPLAHGRWQGKAATTPADLRGWVAVPAGFAGLEKNLQLPRTGVRPEVVVDRGRPKMLTLPGARAGEQFTFRFTL
jgi:hypothetical protein